MTRLRPMLASDYAPLRSLWERTEGLGLNESDEEAPVRHAEFVHRRDFVVFQRVLDPGP